MLIIKGRDILAEVNTTLQMFEYGIDRLTIEIVILIANGKLKGNLSNKATDQINASRAIVDEIVAAERSVYGINTGFGPLCDTTITQEQTSLLQQNLLFTHAVGVGEPISPILSKIMMICKLHVLSLGYSGIRLEVLQRIKYFIDNDLIPIVPEKGSVGASGDLAPLAHLFLPLLGEGSFWKNGAIISAVEVLEAHRLQPIRLEAKEGLALINGTQFILAHAIVGADHMAYLLDLADVVGVMSIEGYQGSSSPFRSELHELRPFSGSITVAKRVRALMKGSENLDSHNNCQRVQDPYSLRCIPQVHGASRNAYTHLKELTEIEMNAVTDNPIILTSGEAISGGNFHGQPLAMALDYGTVAASELANISDRRCYLLLEGKYGLPRFLTDHGGLNSGFMIPQYTTAALVTENKTLCFPASADSIPTSLGQEDHVSMGSISGRKFCQVLENTAKVLAIELMYAAQAMDYRRPLKYSIHLEQIHKQIRQHVARLEEDRMLKGDIDQMVELVEQRTFEVDKF